MASISKPAGFERVAARCVEKKASQYRSRYQTCSAERNPGCSDPRRLLSAFLRWPPSPIAVDDQSYVPALRLRIGIEAPPAYPIISPNRATSATSSVA